MPYFSIVIPCLNEEKVLPRLLSDLCDQSYKDFEVWIIDAKSEDKTQDIVKEFAKRDVRINLRESKKRNVGFQRNLGAEISQSEYLIFFDADNRLPNYFLAGIHYHAVKENSEVFTTFIETDTKNPQDILFAKLSNMIGDQAAKIRYPFAHGAFIGCKRSIFKDLHGFDAELTYGEDTEFVKRAVKNNFNFVVFHEPTFTYSLRRFRKEGTLNFLRKFTPMALKLIKNERFVAPVKDYPMLGGTYFDQEIKKKKNSVHTLKQLESIAKSIGEILSN